MAACTLHFQLSYIHSPAMPGVFVAACTLHFQLSYITTLTTTSPQKLHVPCIFSCHTSELR